MRDVNHASLHGEHRMLDETAEPSMVKRPTYRRHTVAFKLQVCQQIRSGKLGRRDAHRQYRISDNLIQRWLAQYDNREFDCPSARAPDVHAKCEARIAALERKVGQLTMSLADVAATHLDGSPGHLTSD